jgi:hypothetical protein
MKYTPPRLESPQSDELLHQAWVSDLSPEDDGESGLRCVTAADAPSEPTKYLMRAVLTDAVQCFQTNFGDQDDLRAKDFADVRWWLFENEAEGPFSFERVCSVLALDPGCVRQALSDFARKRIGGRVQPRTGRPPVTRFQSREMTDAARSGAREPRRIMV